MVIDNLADAALVIIILTVVVLGLLTAVWRLWK